jgi:DNA-binding CsgD family transcriptional regulator
MKNLLLCLFIACITSTSFSQSAITGYVDVDEFDLGKKEILIYLVNFTDEMMKVEEQLVAKRTILDNGYFEFENTLFDSNDRIYKLKINTTDPVLSSPSKLFIHSDKDSIHFAKSNIAFNEYSSTNLADYEWRKLQKFDAVNKQIDASKFAGYAKDSLQILLVKLISIKQLSDKDLLKKDIQENRDYYLSLLEDFKVSDLDPESYAYLESQCALVTRDIVQSKYQLSLIFNILAFLAILGLMVYIFLKKKQNETIPVKPVLAQLSKQEQTIKNLILEGKSNKEIASELFISLSTVKTHITNLYNKLGVSNRKEILGK